MIVPISIEVQKYQKLANIVNKLQTAGDKLQLNKLIFYKILGFIEIVKLFFLLEHSQAADFFHFSHLVGCQKLFFI